MSLLLYALAGYLIGSIPVAYLITKKRHGIDLRSAGSGNIGARNAFETTGNKRTGFAVLVLDMCKGIVPLLILSASGASDMISVVSVTIVIGHCYPIWLRFHGGRGLATAAAIALLLSPDILLLWIVLYLLSGIIRSQVHIQSFIATAGCLIVQITRPVNVLFKNGGLISGGDHLQLAIILILLTILSRHIGPVYSVLKHHD